MENNNIVIKNLKIAGKFGEFTLEELTLPCTKEAWDILGNLADAASGVAEVVGFENDLSDRDEIKVAEEYETTKEIKAPSSVPKPTPSVSAKVKRDLKMMGIKRTSECRYAYDDSNIELSIRPLAEFTAISAVSKNRECGFDAYIYDKAKNGNKDVEYVIETLGLIKNESLREYLVNLVCDYENNIR